MYVFDKDFCENVKAKPVVMPRHIRVAGVAFWKILLTVILWPQCNLRNEVSLEGALFLGTV